MGTMRLRSKLALGSTLGKFHGVAGSRLRSYCGVVASQSMQQNNQAEIEDEKRTKGLDLSSVGKGQSRVPSRRSGRLGPVDCGRKRDRRSVDLFGVRRLLEEGCGLPGA